jgi:hypothetical protein
MVNSEDLELVRKVFPERGFLSNFPGFAVAQLAHSLRQHNITTPYARLRHPNFTTISGLLSNIHIAWQAAFTNERRGVGGLHERRESDSGESTSATQGGECAEEGEEEG